MIDIDFCISSYLAFRYVAREDLGWRVGFIPEFPKADQQVQHKVASADEIHKALLSVMGNRGPKNVKGILLSGGIDSAILAALMPRETRAYTIRFDAPNAIDESQAAAIFAEHLELEHSIVDVTWDDYETHMNEVMLHKKSPLHAAEIGLYLASRRASEDVIEELVVGNGADSTFGGLDKLLSKDWTFDEFVERYTFVDPALVVKKPVSMRPHYEYYRSGDGIDVQRFLKTLHGLGIIQMFENAIHAGGCRISAPFEELVLGVPLDIQRIRDGDSKYLLREVYQSLFPKLETPEKIPFARPMHDWMEFYTSHSRLEFLDNLDLTQFTGEQRWIIYCLESFLNLIEGAA